MFESPERGGGSPVSISVNISPTAYCLAFAFHEVRLSPCQFRLHPQGANMHSFNYIILARPLTVADILALFQVNVPNVVSFPRPITKLHITAMSFRTSSFCRICSKTVFIFLDEVSVTQGGNRNDVPTLSPIIQIGSAKNLFTSKHNSTFRATGRAHTRRKPSFERNLVRSVS